MYSYVLLNMDSDSDEHGKQFGSHVFFSDVACMLQNKLSKVNKLLPNFSRCTNNKSCCLFFIYFSELGPEHIPIFVSNLLPSQTRLLFVVATLFLSDNVFMPFLLLFFI